MIQEGGMMSLKDNFNLSGKVVLITGGGGYLGKAISEAVSEYGATVIIASRDFLENEKLSTNLHETYGNPAIAVKIDLSNINSIESGIRIIIQRYEKIDVLINNASYGGKGGDFLSLADEDWNSGIDGTLSSVYRITKTVLPIMLGKKSGRIINISSMYGIVAPDVSIYQNNEYYNPIHYGTAKAGIIQFTKYISAVYGISGIRCNCISPGPFPNEQVQKENPEFIQLLSNKTTIGRIGEPNDLKGLILLLASEAGDYINGVNICIDGGWTTW